MMTYKKWLLIPAAAGLIVALSACGAAQDSAAPAAASASEFAAPSGPTAEVKLVASNYKFEHQVYKVKKGQEITLTLENKQGLHGVIVSGLDLKLDNQSKSVTLKADKPGTYDIICSIPCGSGHATMKSKLIIEEA